MIDNKNKYNYIKILNQIFEIEKKTSKLNENNSIDRNINKLKYIFENDLDDSMQFVIENPLNEDYTETRTDVNANISGESTENLIIVDVIKPIIRSKKGNTNQIIQKGIVIAQDKKTIIEIKDNPSGLPKNIEESKKKPLHHGKKSNKKQCISRRRSKKKSKKKQYISPRRSKNKSKKKSKK